MLTTIPQTFGDWLRQQRERQDLTQWVLADRADCSFSTICKLETGGRRPSRQMAICLMNVLKVPDEDRPAILEVARSRPDINEAGALSRSSASYKAKRASQARNRGESRPDAGSNLPNPRTTFIGRDDEVAALQTLLGKDSVRLVTLLGPPGIGKTRLSLQLARSVGMGSAYEVAFVFLSPITDPRAVMPEVATALGINQSPGSSVLDSLKAYLSDKHLLLVLDNFEHVIAARNDLGALLDACRHLKIMVTSRIALDLYGEHLFCVSGLSVPALEDEVTLEQASGYTAIALFEQRACAADAGFRLDEENVPLVAEICRKLDGLPLAIELAAARSKILTPKEILSRLAHRFELLASGPSDLPSRQRSLRGAIDWSYDLLDENERRLFQWMSVFVGAATLDAIESICDWAANECREPRPVLEMVSSLLNKSLIHKLENDFGEARYYLLWTIREYAQERLTESGEEYPAKEKRAFYYANLVDRSEPHLLSGGRDPWLRRLDAEHAHILETLTWCREHPEHIETGLRMAGVLAWYWGHRGHFNEAVSRLTNLLAAADEVGMKRENYYRVKALSALGKYSLILFDYDALQSQLSEAVELWRIIGDKERLAYAMADLGAGLGHEKLSAEGKLLVEEAVSIFEAEDDQCGLAYSLTWLADMHEIEHEWESAKKVYERALHINRELGDSWQSAHNLAALGYLALRDADYKAARAYYGEALAVYRSVNDRWHMAAAQRGMGDVELMEGRLNLAASFYEESLRLYRLHSDRLRTAIMLRCLGYVELQKGHYSTAATNFSESLDALHAIGHKPSVLICLAAFASLGVAQGHFVCAARLSALVEESREQLTAAMSAITLTFFDRDVAQARHEMGEDAFQTAYAEGRRMSIEQAIAHAKATCL